jgi:hypothetical protein
MMMAVGSVLGLALALALTLFVAFSNSPLSDIARWFLLLLALAAGILAALRWQGTYDRGRSPPATARLAQHRPGRGMDRMSEGMFPEPPAPPQPVQIAAQGPWGGPTYSYRGARIKCIPGSHVCGLFMPAHPLHGSTFGVVGTITPLVDL